MELNSLMDKGQGLPLETIVILALVAIVAVVVIIFFLTSQGETAGGLKSFTRGATGDTEASGKLAACLQACYTWQFTYETVDKTHCDGEITATTGFCDTKGCPTGFKCQATSNGCIFDDACP